MFGLDNRQMARPLVRATARPEDLIPLTPPTVADLYKFPSPGNAKGQFIGMIEFSGPAPQAPTCGYALSDIQTFFTNLGLTTPSLTNVNVDGAPNAPTGDPNTADSEVALDIGVAGAVAQGAQIVVYFAPWTEQGWVDVLGNALFEDPGPGVPSVLSISWGWPEEESSDGLTWTTNAIKTVSGSFQDAAMLGVTVFVASGDQGSNCGIGDKKAHVLYPGSDPFVTSCGALFHGSVIWRRGVDGIGERARS